MSNTAYLELAASNNWFGTGALLDDCILRVSSNSQAIAFATQCNVSPPLTIRGSNLKVVGNLDISNGALTSNGAPFPTGGGGGGGAFSNFSVLFRSSNATAFNGTYIMPRANWYVADKRSNCGYELSNVLDANGRITFPVQGNYTIVWSVRTTASVASASLFLDPYNGFGFSNNTAPTWRMGGMDRQFQATTFFNYNFLTTDVISPKVTTPSSQTPDILYGGWYIDVTLHNPV